MQFIEQDHGVRLWAKLSTRAFGHWPEPWTFSSQQPLKVQLAKHMAFIKPDLERVKSRSMDLGFRRDDVALFVFRFN